MGDDDVDDAAAAARAAGSGGRPPRRRPVSFSSRQPTSERVDEILQVCASCGWSSPVALVADDDDNDDASPWLPAASERTRSRREHGTPTPPAPPRFLARRRSSHVRAGGERRQHPTGGDRESHDDDDDDEMTSIVARGSGHDYLSTQMGSSPWSARHLVARRQPQQDRQPSRARELGLSDEQAAGGSHSSEEGPWWRKPLGRFQSIELENKGSVARDHLSLEHTFLAWLRTSLSFASIGIAVTQLFRLNTSLTDGGGRQGVDKTTLRRMGKLLGAAFLGISIVTLLMGFRRYFHAQEWVMRGKFPASRGTIVVMALAALAIMLVSLVVIIVIQPAAEQPTGPS